MTKIIEGMPFEDYASTPGLSVSAMKRFSRAPILATIQQEDKPCFFTGNLIGCAVLEPERFERDYIPTDLDRRGTKAWQAEEDAARGRILVKRQEYDEALYIRDAVYANPTAAEILAGAESEVSAFWDDPEHGIPLKGRADIVNRKLGLLADLKTTQDASCRAFTAQMAKLKYGWQDAHYIEGFAANGLDMDGFVFIAVEKEPPYLTACFTIATADREQFRRQIYWLRKAYAECLGNNTWPGYPEGVQTAVMPAWALQNEE